MQSGVAALKPKFATLKAESLEMRAFLYHRWHAGDATGIARCDPTSCCQQDARDYMFFSQVSLRRDAPLQGPGCKGALTTRLSIGKRAPASFLSVLVLFLWRPPLGQRMRLPLFQIAATVFGQGVSTERISVDTLFSRHVFLDYGRGETHFQSLVLPGLMQQCLS